LVQSYDEAEVHEALDFSVKWIPQADGGVSRGLHLHPKNPDAGPARAVFTLTLPDRPGFAFTCGTHLDPGEGEGDGVVFRASVNDDRVLERDATQSRIESHRIDLTPYAGQTITLTLEADAKTNNFHDWATWVDPMIVADTNK
jgi:hypothetical protein